MVPFKDALLFHFFLPFLLFASRFLIRLVCFVLGFFVLCVLLHRELQGRETVEEQIIAFLAYFSQAYREESQTSGPLFT